MYSTVYIHIVQFTMHARTICPALFSLWLLYMGLLLHYLVYGLLVYGFNGYFIYVCYPSELPMHTFAGFVVNTMTYGIGDNKLTNSLFISISWYINMALYLNYCRKIILIMRRSKRNGHYVYIHDRGC